MGTPTQTSGALFFSSLSLIYVCVTHPSSISYSRGYLLLPWHSVINVLYLDYSSFHSVGILSPVRELGRLGDCLVNFSYFRGCSLLLLDVQSLETAASLMFAFIVGYIGKVGLPLVTLSSLKGEILSNFF